MSHGKDIMNHQLPLKRVAECAMDLFAMAAVTSRATSSLQKSLPSAPQEKALALGSLSISRKVQETKSHTYNHKGFCKDAETRIVRRLDEINHPERTIDKETYQIADAVFENGGYVPQHPLGL